MPAAWTDTLCLYLVPMLQVEASWKKVLCCVGLYTLVEDVLTMRLDSAVFANPLFQMIRCSPTRNKSDLP